MNRVVNIKSICRVCLVEGDNMSQLYDRNINSEMPVDILRRCVRLEYKKNVGFPNQICSKCFSKAKEFIKFQQQCIESEKFFNSFTQSSTKSVKIECKIEVEDGIAVDEPLEDSDAIVEKTSRPSSETNYDDTSACEYSSSDLSNSSYRDANLDDVEEEEVFETVNVKKTSTRIKQKNIESTSATTRKAMQLPKSVTESDGGLKCIVCSATFDNMTIFATHLQEDHSPDEIIKSNISHTSFQQKHFDEDDSAKSITVQSPTLNNILYYKKVTEDFKKKQSALAKDIRSLYKPIIRECKICHEKFPTMTEYQKHRKTHLGNLARPLCNICGKTFSSSTNLRFHQRIHNNDKQYKCSYCDKTFVQWSSQKSHEITHKRELSHVCHICGKGYYRRQHLKYHMQSHSDVKHPCSLCSKEYRSREQLAKHAVVHTGEKNFKCDICMKCFNRRETLRNHRKIHTGERPHVCSVCGKAFLQKHVLQGHMKTHNAIAERIDETPLVDEKWVMAVA